ncbi:MAG TPA: hypothetical protein VGM04_00590 [Sphingomicrobium sp.]|jgi:hypothetical protein
MPRHTLKLLALLTAFAVVPANAGLRVGPATNNHSSDPACPYERARIAAALAQSQQSQQAQQAWKAPTRITLLEGAPSESSLRNVAPGRYFTP